MPVEIRELIIKTQITQTPASHDAKLSDAELHRIKQEILADCLRHLKLNHSKPGSPFER